MTLITGVGYSEHRNPEQAGRIAAQQALERAGIEKPDSVFLFGSIGYRQEVLLRAVRAATGNAPVSGCSVEGIIVPGAVHETNFAATVCAVESDELSFRNAVATGMSRDADAVGREVGQALGLASAPDPLLLVTLADGLTLNFDGVLRGLMQGCPSPHHVPMVGGTASDHWSFHQTFQYCNDAVVGLGGLWLPKPWSARVLSAENLETMVGGGAGERSDAHHRARLSRSISRILYVEDEDANWEVTQLSLRGRFELTRARNSREACERVGERAFDLILMDIQLAGSDLSGIELTEALTGRRTEGLPSYAAGVRVEMPIVFVTAYSSLYSRGELLAGGAQELISKPVDFTHLLMVISRLMVKGALAERKGI
ncbi:MAG: response regulator [Polyangiaceae bacterium]|nr:response regulator [Polyangiaceae bacterium]